jgi:hypothetical protein
MTPSRIPPKDFYRVALALQAAIGHLVSSAETERSLGLTVFYPMLRDEQLWRALAPIGGALKVYKEPGACPAEGGVAVARALEERGQLTRREVAEGAVGRER